MEKKEVIMILVIVGIFLLLNKPYTGYQSFQKEITQAQGSYKIYTNQIETGDSGQQRMIVPNPRESPPKGYQQRCSGDHSCRKGDRCEKDNQFSGHCIPV